VSARAAQLRSTPRRANLKVVRRRHRSLIKRTPHSKLVVATIAGAIVAGAILFGILLEQVVLAQSAFKLTKVRERLVAEEARHEELLLEAASLDSSARIERYAREVLGMVDPGPGQVNYIVADLGTRPLKRASGARLAYPLEQQNGPAAALSQETSP
jgi:cell division protein FtsL